MLQVKPNRMELMSQKKRLAVAVRGHKLLKDKQDALIRLFLENVHKARKLREEVEMDLKKAYSGFLIARSVMDTALKEVIFMNSGATINLFQEIKNWMGVKAPAYKFEQSGNLYSYGFVGTSGELDTALEIFSRVLEKMVALSELEKIIVLMAFEIEKVRRRVNALEYRLIPATKEIIRTIKMKLDEMERSNLSRLMRIKEIVQRE